MTKHNDINLSDHDIKCILQGAILIQRPGTNRVLVGLDPKESQFGSFHLSGFFSKTSKKYDCDKVYNLELSVLVERLKGFFKENKTQIKQSFNFDKIFQRDLKATLGFIEKGLVKKLVPVTYAKYNYTVKEHPLSQVEKLSLLNGSLYGMWGNKINFIGVTPEPLFIIEDGKGYSKALAGTSTKDQKYKILNDPKELNEHKFVVQDIRNKLDSLVTNLIETNPKVVNYGRLSHIQTDIHFEVQEELEYDDLLATLSPTAALGGYPSTKVYEYMKKLEYTSLEEEDRLFGGTIGYSNKNSMFSLVCIRNLYWNEDELIIHSGCGVVSSSIVKKEVQEVNAKRETIAHVYE